MALEVPAGGAVPVTSALTRSPTRARSMAGVITLAVYRAEGPTQTENVGQLLAGPDLNWGCGLRRQEAAHPPREQRAPSRPR
jgi:hypothetical protein